ncbi:succinate dehydrogenase [Yoonia sediminilitoris]|uniref:Succinate dehydrogenase n=1 Tax=Yoonia sediminilitoris TaxID=1286148 RepID=A0A2T6KKA6_9RHOB|nr:succinate dehydrogenase [Yoonia sediminilitoris]PUB16386.1 hypothetical protein C8N45_103241 [Yoonia sediminilitoris]RCW96735.1 hypothetical protein DFP92_103241 [Yoonia sediminilitoris]
MRALIAAVGLLALAACADGAGQADQIARQTAKGVVNNVLSAQYPGVDVSPVTDCVIDNATGAEVLQIAQAAVVGSTTQTTQLVLGIAQRPESVRCIAEKTLTAGNILGALGTL